MSIECSGISGENSWVQIQIEPKSIGLPLLPKHILPEISWKSFHNCFSNPAAEWSEWEPELSQLQYIICGSDNDVTGITTDVQRQWTPSSNSQTLRSTMWKRRCQFNRVYIYFRYKRTKQNVEQMSRIAHVNPSSFSPLYTAGNTTCLSAWL